ncbi:hypothetical protein FACS1894113_3690 [Alphaproteobacteria bacterium]|nr:hypothetical protein FACS1894113_3690 [Alphaproteobacteria bacterium]
MFQNNPELSDADSQNFRNAVSIFLQKLAVQRIGGMRNVGNDDKDDAIAYYIYSKLDTSRIGKNSEIFGNVKRMLFNEYPVCVLYGFSNEISIFYKIPSDSNLYRSQTQAKQSLSLSNWQVAAWAAL